MTRRCWHTLLHCCLLLLLFAIPSSCFGQSANHAQDEATVRATTAAYRDAYNRGDATALADLWVEHGENIGHTGNLLQGRIAIEEAFQRFFAKYRGASIEIQIDDVTFPQDGIAIELGQTTTTLPGHTTPINGHYQAVHVNDHGTWRLLRVEEGPPMPPSNFEHLKSLGWLVGVWTDDTEGLNEQQLATTPVVHTACRWSVNRNFLIRHFTTTVNNQVTSTGTQHIGWHAPTKQIRSWTFDSNGHITTSVWSPNGDVWSVKSHEALPSGKTLISTEAVQLKDQDTQIWRSVHQLPDGKTSSQPDVVVRRHQG